MKAPIVMRLFGDARGWATPGDGQYLKEFDFEAHDGRGEIVMTPDPNEAMRFPGMPEAFAFYHTQPLCKPLRDDGKPNKPLTATHWEFTPLPDKE